MTTLDDTRYCPMCEDAAKKILELEQRVKVLTDAANCLLKTHAASIFMQGRQIGKGEYAEALKQLQGAVNASPQQTAAQIERWHIEWMMKLPVARWINRNHPYSDSADTFKCEHAKEHIPLYLIPQLPKESDSPETDIDESLRRQ